MDIRVNTENGYDENIYGRVGVIDVKRGRETWYIQVKWRRTKSICGDWIGARVSAFSLDPKPWIKHWSSNWEAEWKSEYNNNNKTVIPVHVMWKMDTQDWLICVSEWWRSNGLLGCRDNKIFWIFVRMLSYHRYRTISTRMRDWTVAYNKRSNWAEIKDQWDDHFTITTNFDFEMRNGPFSDSVSPTAYVPQLIDIPFLVR